MLGRPNADFSFSGLKTALRQMAAEQELDEQTKADLAASFQAAITASLVDRTRRAIDMFEERHGPGRPLVVAGGVAANKTIRAALAGLAEKRGMALAVPPIGLCTDNAAMVAWAGIERLSVGPADTLDFAPRPRWPLDQASALAGAKA